jgi:hypothetical protein
MAGREGRSWHRGADSANESDLGRSPGALRG